MSTPRENRENVPDGKFHARKTRTIQSSDGTTVTLGFEWEGGAYIQVTRGLAFAAPQEVINVWDDGADGPLYPRTDRGMVEAIENFLNNYGDNSVDDLIHDVLHNWGR